MILVVGQDGSIGSALVAELRRRGIPSAGSTRRPGGGFFIDLRESIFNIRALPDVTIVCAAVSTVAACEQDPAGSRLVNVDGTLTLARYLADRGSFIIALSTNQVFDGMVPRVAAGAARKPTTEYGRQKAQLENGILEIGERGSIVRLTKVLSRHMPLFDAWRYALARGLEIEPFSDMSLAPVELDDVVEALISLARRKLPGVFQLSAADDVSYADAALRLCRSISSDVGLVRPRQSPWRAPLYTSLETLRAEDELNWSAKSSAATLDDHFVRVLNQNEHPDRS